MKHVIPEQTIYEDSNYTFRRRDSDESLITQSMLSVN